jgi:zinc protease
MALARRAGHDRQPPHNLLRQIGYGVINRRFQRMSRKVDPPFRGAGFGTSDVFRIGRTTNLVVDTVDGGWQRGLAAATTALRQALDRASRRRKSTNRSPISAPASRTRRPAPIRAATARWCRPRWACPRRDGADRSRRRARPLQCLRPDHAPGVLAALKREAVPLDDPLIRFQGRTTPSGGDKAIRQAWNTAIRAPAGLPETGPSGAFAYTDFGTPGAVVADSTEPAFGIREIRFANGVRLNLKRTSLETDRIQVRLSIDGGEMLDTRDNPLATEMMAMFSAGGLGKHSQDDLQTLLAGRSVGGGIATGGDTFYSGVTTTRRDLEAQLQYLAAQVTDPGYRPEGEVLYRQNIANFFARYRATPSAALANTLGGLLSDDDPRFTLQAPPPTRNSASPTCAAPCPTGWRTARWKSRWSAISTKRRRSRWSPGPSVPCRRAKPNSVAGICNASAPSPPRAGCA